MSPVQTLLSALVSPRTRLTTRAALAAALTTAVVAAPSADADTTATMRSGAVSVSREASSTPTRLADRAGSTALGNAAYDVPAGAIVTSTTGSDTNPGTLAAPVRTLARALAIAPTGGAVVMRGGSYRESVTVSRRVTIQNYPKESVWLEGTDVVTGWVRDGSTWRRDGWTKRFDASVGFSKGDRDGNTPGWQWINPSYPMASHPDQVYVDNVALQQVASRSAVTTGKFYLDEATSRLYIGTDPSGVQVRASVREKAMRITGDGTVVRGIGVRRYAPSIWHIGSVTVEAPNVLLENMPINDSATIGLGIVKSDVRLNRVTILRSGLLGIHAATADRLRIARSRIDGNNVERFNPAPVSGGIKAGRSRGVTVIDSSVSKNQGQGYWSDVSVYDTRILNSNIIGNRAAGVFLEISARGTVVNNLITDNGGDGVKVNNTSKVNIYNNTVVRNGRPINIVQDTRRPNNTSYGQDTRYPSDPEMTWLIGPVTVRNNVIGLTSGNCVLCVEDYSHQRTAAQMGVTSNGNVFNRATPTSSYWLTVWSRGTININPAVYTTLSAHRSGTGQDSASLAYDTAPVVATDGSLAPSVEDRSASVAVALPSDLASMTGLASGLRYLGVTGRES